MTLPVAGLGSIRKFRIYAWLCSSDFRPITGRMDENQYSIWMSSLSSGTVYTIRAYGIGSGGVTDNYYLNKIPAFTNPTFLLSNSYNSMTYVSQLVGAYALVIIHDELA